MDWFRFRERIILRAWVAKQRRLADRPVPHPAINLSSYFAVMRRPVEKTITISQALPREAESVPSILLEAAHWLRERGIPMWRSDELSPERIATEVAEGYFFLAKCGAEAVGTIKFQLQDTIFWPDTAADEAAFVHRLAVRRAFAGGQLSVLLLSWAAQRAMSLGQRFLHLDCEASRPRLRAVYERYGFQHHSDRQVGPHFVSRYELPLSCFPPQGIRLRKYPDRTGNNKSCQSLAAAIRVKELNELSQDQTEAMKVESADDAIACPVCGAATVQEKCKVICKSDLCRGRVVYNCAEF
jgi:GNAT superfamily N-acetyltransferase